MRVLEDGSDGEAGLSVGIEMIGGEDEINGAIVVGCLKGRYCQSARFVV